MGKSKIKRQVKWEQVITNIQGNVLEALAKYKFLTLTQMLLLDVGTIQYKYLWEQVKSLRDRKRALVGAHRFDSPYPRKGRVEDLYYLTNQGRHALKEELFFKGSIKIPTNKTPAYKDYTHRKYTIDFQIALHKWAKKAGFNVPFFHTYFDMIGSKKEKNLRAKTRIALDTDFFIPDAMFQLESEHKERFYLFEMYNGKDSKRVIKQLHKHARAMTQRYTHQQFGLDHSRSYSIILVFEFESTKKAVIEKARREISKDGNSYFQYIETVFYLQKLERF